MVQTITRTSVEMRAGYTDDYEGWQLIRWRGAVGV
jgi:hypothetical protein